MKKILFKSIMMSILCALCMTNICCKDVFAKKYKDGDIIKFGKFEQDGNLDNGPEDIEWIVVETSDPGKVMLISKYVLTNYMGYGLHWEASQLRIYLNGDFYKNSFSKKEKSKIILSDIYEVAETKVIDGKTVNMSASSTVKDNVFIIGMNSYANNLSKKDRKGIATPYCVAQSKYDWYQIVGKEQGEVDPMTVKQDYEEMAYTTKNTMTGEYQYNYVCYYQGAFHLRALSTPGVGCGVRPCLYITNK